MPARGRYSGRKRKRQNKQSRVYTRQQHTTGKNRSTHPQPGTAAVQQYYSSTAVSSTALKPAKRFTHPPRHREAVQERPYSSNTRYMCIYILESYPWYHSVPKSFICCCSGRDSCMLISRCMLPSLRSAPCPALCPCEPLRLVGDMQVVSYGARSRQFSPLLAASSS